MTSKQRRAFIGQKLMGWVIVEETEMDMNVHALTRDDAEPTFYVSPELMALLQGLHAGLHTGDLGTIGEIKEVSEGISATLQTATAKGKEVLAHIRDEDD